MSPAHHHTMADTKTIDGLHDTLDDLEKQLTKAEDKYNTLRRRYNAVKAALAELNQS